MSITEAYEQLLAVYGLTATNEERRLLGQTNQSHIAFASAVSTLAIGRLLMAALDEHRESLERSSVASNRVAKKLANATWALVGVTSVLVVVTAVTFFVKV